MQDYQILINLILYSIIPTLVVLIVTQQIKGSIKNSFDEKIKKFEIELNHLKSKENFKFTKLHEKRFEVLQETYIYLNQTIEYLSNYVAPAKLPPIGQTPEEYNNSLKEQYSSTHNKFLEYFNHNKIFFAKDIEQLLDNYFETSLNVYNHYYKNDFFRGQGSLFDDEVFKSLANTYKKIPELIVPIKIEIENKFRELLGE